MPKQPVERRATCTVFRVAIPDDDAATRLFAVRTDGSVQELIDPRK